MLLHYDMPDGEEIPAVGSVVNVSGDPDKPVLSGEVWRVDDEERLVVILIPDGQNGAQAFQEWVVSEGDVGVELKKQLLLP